MIQLHNHLFGTRPIVTHCPGPLHDGWKSFERLVRTSPARSSGVACPDLTVITWDTDRQVNGPSICETTLTRLGVQPLVIESSKQGWSNLQKLQLTAKALQTVRTPYVAGLDAYDVAVLDHPQVLVDRFQQRFDCELVLNSTGSWCWPVLPGFVDFERSRPGARAAAGRVWLNSGVWIGKSDFCRRFFEAASRVEPVPEAPKSDQAIFKRIWPDWYPQVQLDYRCEMFQWFNEDRSVLEFTRSLDPRQEQLLELLRPIGGRLRGVEVGVWDGLTSAALLHGLPDLELWMVDPWTPFEGACSFDGLQPQEFHLAQMQAQWLTSSYDARRFLLPLPSVASATHFRDESLDFVFLDANPVYEHVRNDLRAWWPKVRPGRLLTGHNYGLYGDRDGRWGVRRAVEEFAVEVSRPVRVGLDGVWWIWK